MKPYINKQNILVFACFCLLFITGVFYFAFTNDFGYRTTTIIGRDSTDTEKEQLESNENSGKSFKSPPNTISGTECENYNRRPFAVMIAEDAEARDLSGIGSADLVIEMPVVTGSITRMMALFVCENVKEIGSVRSARHDFVPLALGYDAILAHWGGSNMALAETDKIDNLDAMVNYYDSFYRKKWIPAPHNGFTDTGRLTNAASKLGYRLVSEFSGYKFLENPESLQSSNVSDGGEVSNPKQAQNKKLSIGYRSPYDVMYDYDYKTNSYLRWRDGKKEIDTLTGSQVEVKNIAVMRAASRQIGDGYNDVDVIGNGKAVVYRNGDEIEGTWVKKTDTDVLKFYNKEGMEVEFVKGKIWVNVAELNTRVVYE